MLLNNLDKKRTIKNIFVIIAFSLVLILALVLANKDKPEYTTTRDTGVEYENAKVLAVTEDNSVIDRDNEDVLRGSTELKVEILTGRYKGDICFVTNYFSALYNVDVKPGDTVCVRAYRPEADKASGNGGRGAAEPEHAGGHRRAQ